jgi:hypothetical protein
MADKKNEKVCDHAGCTCPVADDADYCSLHCEEADNAGITEIACECSHAGCSGGLQ